jgi:hypothetical protein
LVCLGHRWFIHNGLTITRCPRISSVPASFPKRGDIVLPICFVKVGGQKETGFIQKHRINAHDEITAMVVLTPQMPPNRIRQLREENVGGDIRNI